MARRSIYKTPAELREMVEPGLITAASLEAVRAAAKAGMTTEQLDAIAEAAIRALGGVPNFSKEPGYRHTICASVNDEVVHGMPGSRVLEPGDILSVDSGAEIGGWNGDAAFSLVLPDPARPELVARREELSRVTELSMWAGIAELARTKHLNDVGAAIEESVAAETARTGTAYGILEEYVGHGIGREMHEDPPVFNYRVRGRGPAVKPGLVVAIEPMITLGSIETTVADDEWTISTDDQSDAAHWEHSIAVHAAGVWVLTARDGGAAGLAPFGVVPVPIP